LKTAKAYNENLFAWTVALTFAKPSTEEWELLKLIDAGFTTRINSSGLLGMPSKNCFNMKGTGTKHIVSLYVTVSIGTWVVFPVSSPPVLGLDLLQFDRRTVAEGVVGGEGTILFLIFASSSMVEHSQRKSALGRVISFDLVILSVSMTIPFALAPDPSKQTSLMSEQVLFPPSF
jgi:hypothetical protein